MADRSANLGGDAIKSRALAGAVAGDPNALSVMIEGGAGIVAAEDIAAALAAETLSVSTTGAANQANGQVTATTTAATLVVARPTRRGVSIRNHDDTISVYIGTATVTAANGHLLKAGESIYVTWVGLIQVIAASGTPAVSFWDEYN